MWNIFVPTKLETMKRIILAAALTATLTACGKSGLDAPDPEAAWSESLNHEMIILGNRLENPYKVTNVTKALARLYPTKADRIEVKPTNLYVRFLPKGDVQFDRLENLGIQMIDHPLDFKILREGDYYHDPDVPDGDITWQYAVVSPDFDFPEDIAYEIIDECYIAENDPATKADSDIDWSRVEAESYRLTGNQEMLSSVTKGNYKESFPSGRISIIDDGLGAEPVGVAGVRVSCNSFVKVGYAFTDEDGYYKIDRSYSTEVRYRLVFKNTKGFCIGFNLLLTPASNSTLGKNPPEGVDVVIDRNSDRKLFSRCVVNNAGYEYYCKCAKDGYKIKTPPSNLRIWLFQNLRASSTPMLQQGAWIDNSILQDYLGPYLALLKIFLPDITLGLAGSQDYASIFNLTMHELAHASHFVQAGKSFWDEYIHFILTSFVTSGWVVYGTGTEEGAGRCAVGEMWAYYVQTILFREHYGNMAFFGGSYWFSPQILLNLDDRGIDRFKIFKALKSEVIDVESLQDELISLYPQSKSIINQAFDRYE